MMAPITRLYTAVIPLSARWKLGRVAVFAIICVISTQSRVLMSAMPMMKRSSARNPSAIPPMLAAIRKSKSWVGVSAPKP